MANVEAIEKFGLSGDNKSSKSLFSKIGVVGCGPTGQAIARMASRYGIEVVLVETADFSFKCGVEAIEAQLDQKINSWGLTAGEKKAIITRITGTDKFEDLSDCDFVVEAISDIDSTDNLNCRKEIFRVIEANVSDECIIATNSDTIAITELATELKIQARSVGVHFMIHSSEAKTCEVYRSIYTSDATFDSVLSYIKLVRREAIVVEEVPGLVSVRLMCTLINEACKTLKEGISTIEDIDKVMKVGFGLRFGPFELADIIGLDSILKYMDNLYDEFGSHNYKASSLITRKVRSNRLGVKTGEGFYCYNKCSKSE